MLENLYTTKMSMDKKKLQNRFTKIRSVSSRISKLISVVMAILVAATMLCATVVMAAFDSPQRENIKIYNNGEEIELINKAFIENDNVYVPLREVVENIVSEDEGVTDIEWNDGTIDVKIAYKQGESGIYRFNIGGSYMKVKHFKYDDFNNISIDDTSIIISINLNQSPILKSSTTYVTVKDINYMIFGFTNRRDENNRLHELTYSIFNEGKDITTIFEYEAELHKDQKEMTSPNRTIELFFKAFYNQEFEKMKRYCTEECVNNFFGDDYVFGMKRATLSQMSVNPKEYANLSNNINAFVEVKMTPHTESVYDSAQTTAAFYMILQKQENGIYLINEFATGI